MEPTEHISSAIGSSLDQNALDSLQFNEEIHNLMTALLDLPPPQSLELLHHHSPKLTVKLDGPYHFNPGPNLTFPSKTTFIERAPGSVPSNASRNLGKVKNEPAESDSDNNNNHDLNSSQPLDIKTEDHNQRSAKRKGREKKGKATTKKSKSGANDKSEDAEKLPYVHVRARRGQATDSHSLAERARREKINARMKLLQELVPGCNKISGTSLVLDEIINHVQSLQRQVEFLSMKLAAVNPRIDFNFDSIFAAERGSLMDSNFHDMVMPVMWPEVQANGNRQQFQQQCHLFDGHHRQPVWGREDSHNFVTPENSLLSYDASANSASLHSNQLKMEL